MAVKETLISFQTSQGMQIQGSLLHMTRHQAVFEVYNSQAILRTSELLTDFRIIVKDQPVYAGKAVISKVINTGLVAVCEVSLDEAWIALDLLSSIDGADKLREGFDDFLKQWQQTYKVSPDFKIIIADMQSFLLDLRAWLEQVELGIRSSPSADRIQMEKEVTRQLSKSILPCIDSIWNRFETTAQALDPLVQPVHRAYLRRQLHPLLLCSPFAYRTYHKPLGYPGDYEVVNMITRDPCEGGSIFAKMINCWLLQQPPAEAHRNRLSCLESKLVEETLRVSSQKRPARIFNLACGPAFEVQQFLAKQSLCNHANFTLVDFNEETLQHTGGRLNEIKNKHNRSTALHLVKRSVHQILKEAGKTIDRAAEARYDFIYCAGIFDYLPDPVCLRLMNIMYDWLAPGGLLLATNVDATKPFQLSMEYILEWHLICRTEAQVRRLAPTHAPADCSSVKSDITGVNIFIEVRKPTDA